MMMWWLYCIWTSSQEFRLIQYIILDDPEWQTCKHEMVWKNMKHDLNKGKSDEKVNAT